VGFLSPWFLGGLLAVGIPLYVHLLKQHKSNPLPFSSLMFFEKRTQSSVKHRRLKYIALLLMRCALIALVAMLFAKPYVRRSVGAGDAQGRKMLLVAVDNSFSMRAGSRMEDAKAKALEVLGTFRGGDRGQVIAFSSGAQLLTQPVTEAPELQAAVRSIQVGDGRSAYGEIARVIRTLAPPDGMPVEAHVITDGQRTSMPVPFAELAVPPGTKLTVHSVAPNAAEPNWYIEAVHAPRSVFQPKKVRVQATVAGSNTEAADTNVSLILNGKTLESKKVNVPANGRTTLEFFLPDAAYGMNRGEIRIDSRDKLAADDAFQFSMERKEAKRMLVVHDPGKGRAAEYYRAALESVPDAGFAVETVTSDQAANLDLTKYPFIVLTDTTLNVEDYLKKGGGVLAAAGSYIAAKGGVLGVKIAEARYAAREAERFYAAGEVDESHPSVARAGKFEDVKFYQVVRLDAGKSRVLAKLTDGTPLLVEQKVGNGRLLVFASTFDNIANDLPLHASFVPFVEQSALYLSGGENVPAQYAVDSFVDLKGGGEIMDPDGKRALSLSEAAKTPAFRLTRAGFWDVRRANGAPELIAVHTDRRESDLTPVAADTLALWQSTGKADPTAAAGPAGEKPVSIWWYFLLALLGMAVVESIFAGKYVDPEERQPLAARKQAA
jgi:hypothetical protein